MGYLQYRYVISSLVDRKHSRTGLSKNRTEQPLVSVTSATSLSSSLTLRLDASQQLYLKQKYQSGLVLDVLQVIGSLGGVFTVVSGFFAVVFGRDLLVIITGGHFLSSIVLSLNLNLILSGGWSLSPVGLLGLFESVRRDFREAINNNFPKLEEEIHGKGMAEFLTEVAIDVTLISKDNGKKKKKGNTEKEEVGAMGH
jgi:hypothetical protein